MIFRRLLSPLLLVFVICCVAPARFFSLEVNTHGGSAGCGSIWVAGFHSFDLSLGVFPKGFSTFEDSNADPAGTIIKTPTDGGIKVDIPIKYQDRFEKWKTELLSTDFGREQWDTYANNKGFILTLTVSNKKGKGAGTDKYLWDENGKFVGATITLGDDLDRGYPDPIYYPVMNSLSAEDTSYSISGRLLAATKISHEFGHVNQTAKANRTFLLLQNRLMPEYTSIFLKNGRDIQDQKLVDLATQMGGTPVEIWESREYWSEVNAMQFLKDRIAKENYYCFVFNKIKRNIEEYAKDYEKRFDQYTEYSNSPCWK
ncbi:MAG: hypothetical protein ABI878_01000 [Acidobacteriota bacterium]